MNLRDGVQSLDERRQTVHERVDAIEQKVDAMVLGGAFSNFRRSLFQANAGLVVLFLWLRRARASGAGHVKGTFRIVDFCRDCHPLRY